MQAQANTYLSIEQTTNYSKIDICAVCRTSLDAHTYRLGPATIHTGAGGAKHPMHFECFLRAIADSGKCPVCRIEIPFEAFRPKTKEISFLEKLSGISLLFAGIAGYHFVLTRFTNSPKTVAAIPGIVGTGISFKRLYFEHADLGLMFPLKHEILKELVVGISMTAISTLSAAIAERVTKSRLANSCITSVLAIAGLTTYTITVHRYARKRGREKLEAAVRRAASR